MYIRSDRIGPADIYRAFTEARSEDGQDIWAGDIRRFRPRRFNFGYQLYAHATSGRRVNGGTYGAGDHYAATWDAYGYVMARLYAIDPDAQISNYANVADFCRQTAQYMPRGMRAGFRALAGCLRNGRPGT